MQNFRVIEYTKPDGSKGTAAYNDTQAYDIVSREPLAIVGDAENGYTEFVPPTDTSPQESTQTVRSKPKSTTPQDVRLVPYLKLQSQVPIVIGYFGILILIAIGFTVMRHTF